MKIVTKQISSLEKIRSEKDIPTVQLTAAQVLKNEGFSYQIVILSDTCTRAKIEPKSEISEFMTIYSVKNAMMDFPIYEDSDDDYITKLSGEMPDILVPIEEQNGLITVSPKPESIWIKIDIPENLPCGSYEINISLKSYNSQFCHDEFYAVHTLSLEVIDAVLPKSDMIFTQWLHADCIATAHNVKIYSEEHWELIDKYIKTAHELGINTILTPVFTPPLDTAIGKKRPSVQLVKITKSGNEFSFDFSLLKKWIELCRKNSIEYFEISHLFSQWGLEHSPNIIVSENGRDSYMFDERTSARDTAYADFLKSFLPALVSFLRKEGIEEKCFFHISDEPNEKQLENYRYAHELVLGIYPECKIIDAISDIDFYKTGLIQTPVAATTAIEPFLYNGVENLWAYYCCAQHKGVSNRFIAMPSYRNRILGFQLYKYGIKGFLQWGYNFYFSQLSLYEINPYVTTSAERAFPSGDAFSVYPGKDGPLLSLRALVFKEALQDIRLCRLLERLIGKDKVISAIDAAAEMNITFTDYPRNNIFIPEVNNRLKNMLKDAMSK